MSKFFPKTRRDAPKWSPKWNQNPPQIDEKSSPSPSWAAVGSQEGPKSTKDVPKRWPRASESGPRAPKSRPRGARETSKPGKNQSRSAPGPHCHALSAENVIQEAVGLIFACFLRRALDGRQAPMCVSSHSCQCFVGVGASAPF